jgi:kinetochore protein Nuf2
MESKMQEDELLHEIAIFFSTQKMDLVTSNRVFSLEKSHLIFPHQMQAVENLRDSFYSRTIPITKYQGNKIQYIAPRNQTSLDRSLQGGWRARLTHVMSYPGKTTGRFVYMATTSKTTPVRNFLTLSTVFENNLFAHTTMSYNPRMSIVPQQQNRGKKKEEDSDAFMRLVRNPLSPILRKH